MPLDRLSHNLQLAAAFAFSRLSLFQRCPATVEGLQGERLLVTVYPFSSAWPLSQDVSSPVLLNIRLPVSTVVGRPDFSKHI